MPDLGDFDARDDLIDEYQRAVQDDIELVFGRFLSGLSDDPREVAFDVLMLELMDAGMGTVIRTAPLTRRAREMVNVVPEAVPDGSTRGLDASADRIRALMTGGVRDIALALSTLANQMALTGASGFREVARGLLDRRVRVLAEAFSQALLAWDRVVLDEIGRLMGRETVWVYAGPADSRNRPFCAEVVRAPLAYTRASVETLNEHPLLAPSVPPNVFTLCGGHGCRHVFLPVSRTLAEASGLEVAE